MRNLTRGLAALTTVLLLAGCGVTTPVPDTQSMRPVGNGVDTVLGPILLQDTVVVVGADGTASISATILNPGEADALIQVSIGGVAAVLTPTDLAVTAVQPLRLGFRSEAFADVPAAAAGAAAPKVGEMVEVTYTFAAAGSVSVLALVVAAEGMYAEVTPAPQPVTPSATPTPEA